MNQPNVVPIKASRIGFHVFASSMCAENPEAQPPRRRDMGPSKAEHWRNSGGFGPDIHDSGAAVPTTRCAVPTLHSMNAHSKNVRGIVRVPAVDVQHRVESNSGARKFGRYCNRVVTETPYRIVRRPPCNEEFFSPFALPQTRWGARPHMERSLPPRLLFEDRLGEEDYPESQFVPSGARSPNPFAQNGLGSGSNSPTARSQPRRSSSHSPTPMGRGSGRLSPMPHGFQPIAARDDAQSHIHSYAGQMNPADLGRMAYEPERMIRACVKVFTTHVHPTYAMPWMRGEETRSTGSGFLALLPPLQPGDTLHTGAHHAAANARCVITNAHVVENHSLIQVRRAGAAEKYVAKVVCIAHDLDLALLVVQDADFWAELEHGEGQSIEDSALVAIKTSIPRLASEVVAIGFPIGGDDVSATRGVVSRILVGGLTDNLCVQIDAAINPGNSGGPVFDTAGTLVGVAFSGMTSANNIGYIIPLPVVHTFLQNFRRHGAYKGKCSDCFEIQSMESATLRKRFGLIGASGVMLSKIPPESSVQVNPHPHPHPHPSPLTAHPRPSPSPQA